VFEKGQGAHLWDIEGRKYIDFTAGIAVTALGHSHPEVARILFDQSLTLMHSSNLYHNLWTGELSRQLVETTKKSGGMHNASRVFLANSGTEANEAALKFARKYGKAQAEDKTEFITFESSFHGRSMGALSVTPNPKYQAPFAPLIPGVHVAKPTLESIQSLITDKTCGVIIEPIQGEGGVRPIPAEFLVELKKLSKKHGALLIYDEIQCGLGRTGALWAHGKLPKEAHPDILTMAKALGNGFPIGATMITEEVEDALKVGDHGTTYGGNPLGARVGSYVLTQVSNEEFLEGVKSKSKIFIQGLNSLKEEFPEQVVEVRGEGLILGIQFAENPAAVVDAARERGLLIITAGGNTIRFVPALNIGEDVIQEGLTILKDAISSVYEN
jgi:acetylornithine aminotransferase